MDPIEVHAIDVQWNRSKEILWVHCVYITRDGWDFSFSDHQNREVKWTEELDREFTETVGGSNIGQYMANVAGGDGKW
jgi:hypothetical protein